MIHGQYPHIKLSKTNIAHFRPHLGEREVLRGVEVDPLDLVPLAQHALARVAAGHREEDALVVVHLQRTDNKCGGCIAMVFEYVESPLSRVVENASW